VVRFGGGVATTYELEREPATALRGSARERPAIAAPSRAAPRAGSDDAGQKPLAQTGISSALQGFSENRDRPANIESSDLEIRDKDKLATFSGNVRLAQGDTT